MISKALKRTIFAYKKGYRVSDKGEVISPFSGNPRELQIHSVGDYERYVFSVASENSYIKYVINVHQLVAYQKFGKKILEANIQVRHLDGNSLNNRPENIDIGTGSENMHDRSPGVRLKHAIETAAHRRKFTDNEVEQIRQDYIIMRSYKDVMSLWDISSKGTLHHLLNNKYVTKK